MPAETQENSVTEINVREIRENFGVSRRVFSRLAGYSERAVAGWEAGKCLTPNAKNKMTELLRLHDALSKVMNVDSIGEWLQEPNKAFDNLKPIEVVERGQVDRIWRMIFYLQSGVPS